MTNRILAGIDDVAARLPKTSDRWLAVVVLLAVGYFSRASVIEFALGAIIGGLAVWIWQQPEGRS